MTDSPLTLKAFSSSLTDGSLTFGTQLSPVNSIDNICNKFTRNIQAIKELELFQLSKSSYVLSEFVSFLMLLVSVYVSYNLQYNTFISIIIFVLVFHGIWLILFILFIPKLKKPPINWYSPTHSLPTFFEKIITISDGYQLKYYITDDNIKNNINNKKIMFLACPLGQCGTSVFSPLLCHLGNEYVYISCDYRGFFGSQKIKTHKTPPNGINLTRKTSNINEYYNKKIRKISINLFASDIYTILKNENIDYIDVMVGHSLGVSVTLEFSVLFPNRVKSLILLNGAHGTVFNTAFQPVLRIPFVGDILNEYVSFVYRNPWLIKYVRKYGFNPIFSMICSIYCNLFGSKLLTNLYGNDYLYDFFDQYLGGITNDDESLKNWIRSFQELHGHSVYHLLDEIKTPTLIISGMWDILTPALHSFEMARKMKCCRHRCDIYSSHATIMENPEACVFEICNFLKTLTEFQKKFE